MGRSAARDASATQHHDLGAAASDPEIVVSAYRCLISRGCQCALRHDAPCIGSADRPTCPQQDQWNGTLTLSHFDSITSCDKLSDLGYNTMHAIDQVDCAKKEQK